MFCHYHHRNDDQHHLCYADHHLHQALPSAGQARLTAEQERDDINYISGYHKYHLQLATR